MRDYELIETYISKYFDLGGFHKTPEGSFFVVHDYDYNKFEALIKDLDELGYVPFIEKYADNYRIGIADKKEVGESKSYINILLFVVTLATTIYAGYQFAGGSIWDGVAFAGALLGILGVHESAHYFAAKKHGVKSTLPYFIPAPTLIGTFGAVINVKSPIPNKNALFDLGYSGPLAGILVTIPVLIVGITLSKVVPITQGSTVFYPSPLMSIFMYFLLPPIPAGYELQIHPLLFAAWVGIIVTLLNMMPVAFLDGGHMVRSIFNENIHRIISMVGILITIVLGWYTMAVLMMLILYVNRRHPGALDDVDDLTFRRKVLAVVMLVVFILCLTHIPTKV
ncbi:peptidase M50 [Methanobacterium lacus]|uniref:Peptidase M50 n=1 Tax=Methanobacterium lacus (strain AL-21) TaxID=877455 RepID=F0T9J8_METLA|nr:site-2 protease family protein [Methanobacterium lacus]ADZ08746.1 peptidase M50 [Methanobacterium lacus]